jgi:biotin carboxyl carrier protein
MRTYKLRIGGESFEAKIVEYSESKVVVNLNGDLYEVEIQPDETPRTPTLVRSARERRAAEPTRNAPEAPKAPRTSEGPLQISRLSAGIVTAPIPGVVKTILVKEGDTVQEGDVVLIIEAMKMDNEIASRSHGVVKTIHVAPGDPVQEDQVLIDIEAR